MRTLVVTDGSRSSHDVVRFGARVVGDHHQPLTILTIVRRASDRRRGEVILKKAQELLRPLMPDIRSKLRVGQVLTEITRETIEGDYELVIIGDRPTQNPIKRLFGHPLPLRLVEKASCAVLIAKGQLRSLRKILICDSGGDETTQPSEFVLRLLDFTELEEEVTVLHVMSQISAWPGVRGQHLRAEAEDLIQEHSPEGQILQRDLELLDQLTIHIHPKIRHGFIVDEILDESRAGDYDLVIIGAHRRDGWEGFLLEDIARKIILQIDRPVLVVPNK